MDASDTDLDMVGRLDDVFLRGAGTGVGAFADSPRDPTLVDDVTVDVVSVYDQTDAEKVSFPINGIRGGVESFSVGEVPAKRSPFCGVDDSGCVPVLNPRLGGLPGDKTSLSNEDDAEKYCVLSDTQLATDSLGDET